MDNFITFRQATTPQRIYVTRLNTKTFLTLGVKMEFGHNNNGTGDNF